MKVFKYVLYAVGALVVLAVIVAIAVAVLFDANKLKGEIERVVKQETGRTLKLEGDLRLAFWPSIGASMGHASLSERASAASFASIDSAHVAVALLPLLRGETLVDQVQLTGLKVNLVKRPDGKFNFDDLLGAAAAPAKKAPAGARAKGSASGTNVQFDISGVRIERSSVSYRDLKSGQQIAVNDMRLRTGRIASGVPGKLEFSAAIKGSKPEIDASFKLSTGYRFDTARKTAALDGLESRITVASPELPQKTLTVPITGSAQADFGKETVRADLAVKLDDSNIRAKLGLESFAPAAYSFDVDIDRLNVDRYLPPRQEAKGGGAGGGGARAGKSAATDTPVDLSALKGLNARGRLHVGQLQVQGLKLAEVKTDVRAARGRAELGPHSAKLYQGSIAGALALDGNTNGVSLKDKLTGISIGPLIRDVAQRDVIEGRGNVALDVRAVGASVNAMKKSLAGNAQVALHDGAIKGFNLGEALRKAESLTGSKAAQSQATDQSQQTDFSEMTASFVIRNGVAHNDDLSAKAPLFRVSGAGDIDIGKSRIEYRAKASVVGTAKGQGGRERSELRGLTVPVRLTGPFDAMRYEVDYGAVAAEAVKSQAAKKIEERLGGKAGGGIEDKLRGLFKR
jgi:AsmA protein